MIGVADMGNRFVISFPDAPLACPTAALALWVDQLRARDDACG